MKRDSRLSATLHALLHMADHTAPVTSEVLAKCMSTNPAVVRRTMAGLREAGLVTSEKGHGGGWRLARDLTAVTLADIYRALGTPEIFAIGNKTEDPVCLVERAVNHALGDALAEAETRLLQRLGEVTLASLADELRRHRSSVHQHGGPDHAS
ncbi:Rrf2 family transcriptional regulator [Methylobrevis pamukkalensis]|uniref:Putative HTH-type transcriptional regulator YwnA n=1 Tax=Methylobrevis pamukkalensis TaxID=1439726 RepID=A0A1E3GXT9_9HYPH|nr:Rrf2 family transcriptional regulator [Methylobrevis pamukkalensis]ODN68878.1 putative HTH-type transcriptional regulator YwnA [Methylobrevis pamukkalensis]